MIEIVLIVSAVTFVSLALFIIGGVTIYDVQDIRTKQLFKRHPFARRYRNRPVVTVLIIASQETESVRQCLESLKASSYRRLEIIVVATAINSRLKRLTSTQGTRARPVRLFKSIRSKQAAISAAYRRYGRGDIVFLLEATDTLDPMAISRAVWHFNTHKNISALYTHRITNSTYSSIGLFQTYIESLMRLWNKFMSTVSHVPNYDDNHGPLFYRKDAFLHRHTSGVLRSHFADDVISYRRPISLSSQLMKQSLAIKVRRLQSIKHPARRLNTSLLNRYVERGLMLYVSILLVGVQLLLGYFMYLGLVPHQPLFLLIFLGLISLFLLFGLWSDQQRSLSKKLLNSLLIPASFIPLLIFLFFQLGQYVAAILSLMRTTLLKLLSNKKARNSYGYD